MPKATPQNVDDPTAYKDYKPEQLGSGIVVLPDKSSKGNMTDYMGASKPMKTLPEGAKTLPYKPSKTGKSDVEIVPLAKGGSASSRADGIAQRGKTRGKMIMCGGGKA